jgi:hypothetical protein
VGAFSGVENAKMWGSSPEMPKTGSPLAKGELVSHFASSHPKEPGLERRMAEDEGWCEY